MRAMQSACRANFNHYSHGNVSFITEGHKEVFTALTSGMPNFCLTSIYLNGRPAVAVVLVDREGDHFTMAPCFVSITPGMTLRSLDGEEIIIGN